MTGPDAHAVFASDWLALREAVDHRSRALDLTRAAAGWLADRPAGWRNVVDLGCGHGSNLIYLEPYLPADTAWRLVDHDPDLLDIAMRRGGRIRPRAATPPHIERVVADIGDLDRALGARPTLVSAAALLDLVSRDWIERLASACRKPNAAVLCVLNITGRFGFHANDQAVADSDDRMLAHFLVRHQRRDKGLGQALGPDAPRKLAQALAARGYAVTSAASDWHLGAAQAGLAQRLIAGWIEAAAEIAPAEAPRFERWAASRQAALEQGRLTLTVGHLDILGLPGG